jgi:predicted DNA-binding protein
MSEEDDNREEWEKLADEEFKEQLRNQTPEQRAAHLRQIYEAITNDPELFKDFPADVLEAVKEGAEKMETANRNCDIAAQNLTIAKAKRDATAALLDSILADPNLRDTEH